MSFGFLNLGLRLVVNGGIPQFISIGGVTVRLRYGADNNALIGKDGQYIYGKQ